MLQQNQDRCRIAITGIGVVSPIGQTVADFWQSIAEGRSGIRARGTVRDRDAESRSAGPIGQECAEGPASRQRESEPFFVCPYAGEASGFCGSIDDFGPLERDVKRAIRKALKLMNRETQMAVSAGQQALADSRLLASTVDREQIGVCFGADNVSIMPEDFLRGVEACVTDTGQFDFDRWGTDGLPEVAPLWLLKCLPNMPACYLAIFNGLLGPNNSITEGSVSANLAVAEACRLIEDQAATAVLTGATGTTLQPFNLMHTLPDEQVAADNEDPATVCRPFDRTRTGTVPAEGAAAFVLEEFESAVRRGARIYGEVTAAASGTAADRSGAPACRRSLAHALSGCLQAADWPPEQIGHLHAHGLGTPTMDAAEAAAIRDVFASVADRLPVVALKSYIGNAGAGAGALEMAASLLAVHHRRLFPVLNYRQPDPQCPIRPVRSFDPNAGRCFVNVSLASHGKASCVAVSAWEQN